MPAQHHDVYQPLAMGSSIGPTHAGGGLSPFGTRGERQREKRFSFKLNVNYTFELITKIGLSSSPTTTIMKIMQ